VKDLARKLRLCINAYSANAKPIQWRYSDPTRRIRSNVSLAHANSSSEWREDNDGLGQHERRRRNRIIAWAAVRPRPDCCPGYYPIAPSALKNARLNDLIKEG
jgi:hypothetical protein